MKDVEYLRSFLPAEVYKDYQANVPEYHPESMFNSDEDRMFCGLTMAIEDEAERIGVEVFEQNGHTAAEAREFYDQGALDDVAAWMAAEIDEPVPNHNDTIHTIQICDSNKLSVIDF